MAGVLARFVQRMGVVDGHVYSWGGEEDLVDGVDALGEGWRVEGDEKVPEVI